MNDVHISEVPKFLDESLNITTHAILLTDPFYAAHQLIILLQLNRMTTYFYLFALNIAEHENDEIPNIHLTAEEPPLDPSTNEYLEQETQMSSITTEKAQKTI